MNHISKKIKLVRNQEKFLFSSLGEEGVMMDLESGNYISINSVGSDIWQLLEKEITKQELIQQLITIYNISAEQCEVDLDEFLLKMIHQEMVITSN